MPYFLPINHGSWEFDCSHLDPFQISVYSKTLGRDLGVRCRFTNHVFSSKRAELNPQAGDVATHIDDRGSRRYFDPTRYQYSKSLPEIIPKIASNDLPVWQTAESKIWVAKIIMSPPSDGQDRIYFVFFSVKRYARGSNQLNDLDMTVQTAYMVDPSRRQPNLLGKAKFGTVVTQAFLGKTIRTHKP